MDHIFTGNDNAAVKDELNEAERVQAHVCLCRVKVAQRNDLAITVAQNARVGIAGEQQRHDDCLVEVTAANGRIRVGLIYPFRLGPVGQALAIAANVGVQGQRGDRVRDQAHGCIDHANLHGSGLVHHHTGQRATVKGLVS